MQALFWLAVRALTKLGIAMAASKAMIATTIMISTRVNPEVLTVLTDCIFILFFFLTRRREQSKSRFSYLFFVHELLLQTVVVAKEIGTIDAI